MLLVCAAFGAARAQDEDPPGRLARLSDAEVAVSLQPAGLREWTAAELNRPLTSGDTLWSDRNSRAELDLGDAAIRLGSYTGFSFLNLDDARAQMQVTAGTLIVRVRDMQPNQSYEVDTPNLALSLRQPGEYRLDVSEAGDATVVKVGEGAAQAFAAGQTIAIVAQQSVTFSRAQSPGYASLGAPDDLDAWSSARDLQAEDAVSSEYVASDVPGTQDLDNNGVWQDTPEYGYVWMPTAVVAGWAPYRSGHWTWVAPWGWTWVDAAPWGYAPFHYGRWVQCNNSWCWVPGPHSGRPLYAPALVAWVDGAAAPVPAVSGSSVGWFPLAPREMYVPGYQASAAYLRKVNVTDTKRVSSAHITGIHSHPIAPVHYANNRAAAVTSLPQQLFTSGQRLAGMPASTLAGAVATAAPPAILPTRQSVLGAGNGRAVVRPPAAVLNRTVLARTPPPRAPAPFDRQLAALQTNGGRPLPRGQLAKLQPPTAAASVRVIAARGTVIAATALPHRPDAAANVGFAAREQALQHDMVLPAAPRLNHPRTPAAGSAVLPVHAGPAAPAETPPALQPRTDGPPSAPQYLPPAPQRAYSAGDSAPTYNRPSPLPVFHQAAAPDGGTSAPETEGHRAPPPPAPPAVAAPAGAPASAQEGAHPQAPAPAKEPRESAAHGDRDSRERIQR